MCDPKNTLTTKPCSPPASFLQLRVSFETRGQDKNLPIKH